MIRPIDIVVLGSKGCGKSSLITQYCNGNMGASMETIHDKVYITKLKSPEGNRRVITLLDTTHVDFEPGMRHNYIKSARGVILVYSICDFESYSALGSLYGEVCRVRSRLPPFILIGTKLDRSACRAVSYDEGLQLASHLGADLFLECSAKSNEQVMKAVQPLVKYLTARATNRNSVAQSLDAHPGSTAPDLNSLAESLVVRRSHIPMRSSSEPSPSQKWRFKSVRGHPQIKLFKDTKDWAISVHHWAKTVVATTGCFPLKPSTLYRRATHRRPI